MDKFSSGWAVLIIGALECIAIGWVYGFRNFQKDIALMIGPSANNPLLYYYSTSCWLFISPALLVTVVVISWLQYKPLQTDDYIFPQWVSGTFSKDFFFSLFQVITIIRFKKTGECDRLAHDHLHIDGNDRLGDLLCGGRDVAEEAELANARGARARLGPASCREQASGRSSQKPRALS